MGHTENMTEAFDTQLRGLGLIGRVVLMTISWFSEYMEQICGRTLTF